MMAGVYGRSSSQEEYLCNFGVNPNFVDILEVGGLKVVGSDVEGAVRAVELAEHPFFAGTLFLPQHSSTAASPHPLVSAFIKTVLHDNAA